jgi:hypothetical protein
LRFIAPTQPSTKDHIMTNRIAQQATRIEPGCRLDHQHLGSINILAVQPAEQSVMAAERAASQVAASVHRATNNKQSGG